MIVKEALRTNETLDIGNQNRPIVNGIMEIKILYFECLILIMKIHSLSREVDIHGFYALKAIYD